MKVIATYEFMPDGRGGLSIEVDGERRFHVFDGSPEDNNLGRNFEDCSRVLELMRLAYLAGKNGEHFTVKEVEVTE